MSNCKTRFSEQFLKQIEEAQAEEVVISVLKAVNEHMMYAKAQSTAERTAILLKKRKVGQVHQLQAQLHYEKRNSQLRYTKKAFAELFNGMAERKKKNIDKKLNEGALTKLAIYGKKKMVLELLNSDIRPLEARRAIKKLDDTIETTKELKSLKQLDTYVQKHLDEVVTKKIGNPTTNGLCLLLLLLTSLFLVLMVVALVICIATLGFFCDEILDSLIRNACGSS